MDIASDEQEQAAKIFPNPSLGIFTIENPGNITRIEVCSVTGEIILEKKISADHAMIDLSGFPPGVYFARCFGDGKFVSAVKLVLAD
jgi:hypothetical protein